jgi:V8-like Glu-specific endopeptidase
MNHVSVRKILEIIGIFLFIATLLAVIGERGRASAIADSTAITEQSSDNELTVHYSLTENPDNNRPWTEKRLEAAKPYPLVRMTGTPSVSAQFAEPDGEPGMVPSSPPAGQESNKGGSGSMEILSPTELMGYTYPPPYIRYWNFDSYLEFPYSTVGVLFFTQNGIDYRCSAASIGENAIWTAGHCMHAGDGSGQEGYSTNVVFIPAYKNGDEPFGRWEASDADIFTTHEWRNGNCPFACEVRYDMGGARLLPQKGTGKKLSDVVGSLGVKYNLPDSQHWFNIGYPSLSPFSGKWQHICAASFAYHDTNLNVPFPVGMGCDMTPGSSGGPWIVNFSGDVGNTNFINGNNSYRYTRSEEIFSPYFGVKAKILWDHLTLPMVSKYLPIMHMDQK